MNKKILGLVVSAVAVFALSGCGGGGGGDYVVANPPVDNEISLFLVDDAGIGVQFVPYTCYAPDGTIVYDYETDAYGEFTFIPGDRCEFDLFGFSGTVGPSLNPPYPLYIVDDLGAGKDDIPYSCDNSVDLAEGVTDIYGYFDYPEDAYCKFYL